MNDSIPHYKNDPVTNAATAPELKLYRPTIKWSKAVLYVVIHTFVAIIVACVWTILNEESVKEISIALFSKVLVSFAFSNTLTSRFTFIWFVRLYQKYAKSETRLRCCMTPSCSDYAILALKKYGTIVGGIKTFGRLLRCHPPGGVDYP